MYADVGSKLLVILSANFCQSPPLVLRTVETSSLDFLKSSGIFPSGLPSFPTAFPPGGFLPEDDPDGSDPDWPDGLGCDPDWPDG